MRWSPMAVLILVSLAVAGCTVPPEPKSLFGYCPQWVQGPGSVTQTVQVGATAVNQTLIPTSADGTPAWEFKRHPFDMVRLHIQQSTIPAGATLYLRAVTRGNGTVQHSWREYSASGASWLPALQWTSTVSPEHDYEAYLTSVDQKDRPVPQAVELSWNLEGGATPAMLSYNATFHYKVCGADL